jgi:hypothetical protein
MFDAGRLNGHRIGQHRIIYRDSVDAFMREHGISPERWSRWDDS